MKRMTSIIVNSLFAILLSGGPFALTAQAQYDAGITVDIPFAFSADGQEIAAGTYQLQLINSNFLMSVRNVNTGNEQMLTVRPETDRSFESHGRLIFEVCNGRRSLAEVHIPGTNLFSETVSGRRRKGVEAASCSKEDSTTIALR